MQTKRALRQEIRRCKARLSTAAQPIYAQRALELLSSLKVYQDAAIVLLYAALPDEVPTQLIIESAHGKTVLLPCVVGDNLELRVYTTTEDLVESDAYHIPEPVGPVFSDYTSIDLAVVPGMAFDTKGHRLGRGKGFYDRFLTHDDFRGLHKIGLCYDFQVLDDVPADSHDIAVDEILVVSSSIGLNTQ